MFIGSGSSVETKNQTEFSKAQTERRFQLNSSPKMCLPVLYFFDFFKYNCITAEMASKIQETKNDFKQSEKLYHGL